MKGFCDICQKKFARDYNIGIVWCSKTSAWMLGIVTYGASTFHGKLFCSIVCAREYGRTNNITNI